MDLPVIWNTECSGGLHIGEFCIADHANYHKQSPTVGAARAEYELLVRLVDIHSGVVPGIHIIELLDAGKIHGPGAIEVAFSNGEFVIVHHLTKGFKQVAIAIPPYGLRVELELLDETIFVGSNELKPTRITLPKKKNKYLFSGAFLNRISHT